MSTQDAPMPRSPLHAAHAALRAAFGEVDGWEMPRVYENIKMEYLSAKGTVAVIDRSHHGRLRVTGGKRLDLLHRLTTNDLKGIGPGQGARTVMLTDKGRIVDLLRLHAGDDSFDLVTSPGIQTRIKETIERLRFRDDVTVTDITATSAMIALLGPQAAHLLESVCRASGLADLPPWACRRLEAAGVPFTAARIDDMGGAGFELTCEAGGGETLWKAIFGKAEPYGASPCAEEAWEMLRIERGLPRFGRELTEDYNPLEARLDAAISWTKGCYVGQEVVARLDSRQKLARLLVGLRLEPGPVPEAGSPIEAPDRPGVEAGRITSVAPSLDLRRVIGLGYVRTDLSEPGTPLTVLSGEDRIGADVAALPFRSP